MAACVLKLKSCLSDSSDSIGQSSYHVPIEFPLRSQLFPDPKSLNVLQPIWPLKINQAKTASSYQTSAIVCSIASLWKCVYHWASQRACFAFIIAQFQLVSCFIIHFAHFVNDSFNLIDCFFVCNVHTFTLAFASWWKCYQHRHTNE